MMFIRYIDAAIIITERFSCMKTVGKSALKENAMESTIRERSEYMNLFELLLPLSASDAIMTISGLKYNRLALKYVTLWFVKHIMNRRTELKTKR